MVLRRHPLAEHFLAPRFMGVPSVSGSVLLIWLVVAATQAGCGATPPELPVGAAQLKALAILHGRFIGTHAGRSLASEKAFRQFVEKEGRGVLRRFGVGAKNDPFVSPRDHQPIVLLLDSRAGTDNDRVFAYEKEGVDGKRLVVTELGSVELLADNELQARLQ